MARRRSRDRDREWQDRAYTGINNNDMSYEFQAKLLYCFTKAGMEIE